MTKKLDEQLADAMWADARALEAEAESTEPYPPETRILRPNRPSRVFNVR